MSAEIVIPRDLNIDSVQTFAASLFVNGWVTIRSGGRLECQATVQCLGMSVENGGTLHCPQLATNVLDVARSAKLEVTQIRARVVQHEHFALRDLIDEGFVKADYIQHIGGNEYVRGHNPLAEKFFEARTEGDPVVLEPDLMRATFREGRSVFRRMEPLVPPRSKLSVSAATREATVEELEAWLAAHPGPQRATLDALEAEWTTRLSELSAEARTDAMFVVTRAIKSPKLVDRLDALRAAIGL